MILEVPELSLPFLILAECEFPGDEQGMGACLTAGAEPRPLKINWQGGARAQMGRRRGGGVGGPAAGVAA